MLGPRLPGRFDAACCDLLAVAGFATDSPVGDRDHERAELLTPPCAAGWAGRAPVVVRHPFRPFVFLDPF